MHKELLNFVSEIFPFKNLKSKTLEMIFDEINYSVSKYNKGDVIFSPSSFHEKVGFVISGECSVERQRDSEDSICLNTLKRCSSFGILSVIYPGAEFPTTIKALKNSSILFIPAEDMIAIIRKYPTISFNVIKFLASRIAFLNEKIATFSEKSTLKKLSSYLLMKFKENGNTIETSKTKISSEIGVGRASLYRDLDYLVESKIIKLNQKQITIICPEGLERI